jgi:hypothetical protein
VIVPIGEGKEVEARAIAAELQAFIESYSEEGLDEVIIEAPDDAILLPQPCVLPLLPILVANIRRSGVRQFGFLLLRWWAQSLTLLRAALLQQGA